MPKSFTIWPSKVSKYRSPVKLKRLVFALILNEANSNIPLGAVSEGEVATTITALPELLADSIVVFSTTVDMSGLVMISLVNLTSVGSKLYTTLAKAILFPPEFIIIFMFVAGGTVAVCGEKNTPASAEGGVGVITVVH